MDGSGESPRALGVSVFAAEDRSLQVTWSGLARPGLTLEVGGQAHEVGTPPPDWYRVGLGRRPPAPWTGPGAVVVDGLDPDTRYDVVLGGDGARRRRIATGRTLPAPSGQLLTRFATISDCHIGESRLGLLRQLRDPRPLPDGLDPYPVRCALAALAEAESWGAELIVVKGDLTREAELDEAEEVASILSTATVPVEAALGNHDVRGPADVASILAVRGITAAREARAIDLPGLRLIIGHSPVKGRHGGLLEPAHLAQLVELAADSTRPVALALHHPPRRSPVVTYYPPSIGWRDSARLVSGLAATGRGAVVLAGHSHRNRRYQVGPVTVSEVGSTKDYPGQWAGYAVYESGIRQVVRRTARPEVIAWTEMTRRALGGVWGRWSRGTLADRCWTLEWPDRVVEAAGAPG